MKYTVDYEFLPRGFSRPHDQGRSPAVTEFDDDIQLKPLLPSAGDHVRITDPHSPGGILRTGRVKSRLFSYVRDTCHINILVEEIEPEEWESLDHVQDTAA